MPNYQDGKIYTIRCKTDNELIYVGSTVEKLSRRMAGHRGKSKKTPNSKFYSKVNDNWDNWFIELYELYPCNTKEDLQKREGEIIRKIGNLNHIINGRTQKEYYADNIDRRKKYSEDNKDKRKEYCKNNKDKIKGKSKEYNKNNKDKIKENKKQNYLQNIKKIKESRESIESINYHKEYNEKNKEKIKEQTKEYREKNKEKIKELNRIYYLRKKNLIL